MCRALLYLGRPVILDDLLFKSDSSLVKQSYMPRKLRMLNLAGFGMMAWDDRSHTPERPFRYASPELPIFDRNLKSLAEKVRCHSLLAHVRGVAYNTDVEISKQNTHPFNFPGCQIAMAHNGDLYRVGEIKAELAGYLHPEFLHAITGSTDSEWIYALILSRLDDPYAPLRRESLRAAVTEALEIIARARAAAGIETSSSVNLFFSDGQSAAALRFCFDFGCYRTASPDKVHEANLNYLSLWYTMGREFGFHDGEWQMIGDASVADSVIFSSEPLTHDTTRWLEVPEYALVTAEMVGGHPEIAVAPVEI